MHDLDTIVHISLFYFCVHLIGMLVLTGCYCYDPWATSLTIPTVGQFWWQAFASFEVCETILECLAVFAKTESISTVFHTMQFSKHVCKFIFCAFMLTSFFFDGRLGHGQWLGLNTNFKGILKKNMFVDIHNVVNIILRSHLNFNNWYHATS